MQKEENGRYNKWFVGFLIVFIILLVILSFTSSKDFKILGNVALIKIDGVIAFGDSGLFGDSVLDPDEVIEFIDEAEDNPSVKVILFEINSPGGSAVASQEIVQRIRQIEKPTYAVIREVGASGGYWIASATDHITANQMSITGSVGVIASYLEYGGLLDRYNVSYERLVAGENKDIGTPFRELTKEEREFMQQGLDAIHQIFLDDVTQSRKLTAEQVEIIKTGRFFIGMQAKELNLIDALGTKSDAVKHIESVINETVEIVEYDTPKSFFESLSETAMQDIGFGIGSAFAEQKISSEISIKT